ncbi:hypothetical protein GCM10011349_31870 [Novosphingobium indicum]|uniref:Uncharacterized protein n=2 Tax=Novosphingobium TaxID=165696 RepID=A0ABQ2JUU1_9SPHN|nr:MULTISPECIES: hypothetical protein [Novosphingobium]MCJ2180112.1 hypothetical protein [Novosphingobium album (ex Hu et al. 2023)]GGN55343.1 hypothetical protein GCM10011349_31870 [Novosphingobium indicum]
MTINLELESFYREASEGLLPSRDPKIERMKCQIANCELAIEPVNPTKLAKMNDEGEEWGNAAFATLRANGFIDHHSGHFTWTRLDNESRVREFEILAAIEAVVLLRSQRLDMEPLVPSLEKQIELIRSQTGRAHALETCVQAQMLLLMLVASMNATELFREYASLAKSSWVYAWSASLGANAIEAMCSRAADIVKAVTNHDGLAAARAVTALRGVHLDTQCEGKSGVPLA